MKSTYRWLLLICAAALGVRVLALLWVDTPGLHDALHYYNLGERLLAGDGFTIDYVWQYLRLYDGIVHPIDYWMPLTGIIAAAGMVLFGMAPQAALLPFLLMGAVLPALSYAAARTYHLSERTALVAAALTVAVPELMWQSTRLLTTTPHMLLVGGSIVLFVRALHTGRWRAYIGGGVLAGLAYLNRTDTLLLVPMVLVTLVVYGAATWRSKNAPVAVQHPWRLLVSVGVAVLVALPWLLHNQQAIGQMTSVENSRVFFMVEYDDHHSYDNTRITLERLLSERTIPQLIGKRLFELAAAFKQMAVSLSMPLAIGATGGLLLLLWKRQWRQLLALAPVLILLLGILTAYPLLIPMKSQGGSFRTAFSTLVPLLIPLAAFAITTAITDRRFQVGLVALLVSFQSVQSLDMLRLEAAFIDDFFAFTNDVVMTLDTLPDVNGDGDIRLMTQDPLVFSYFGVRSALVPNGTRDEILAAARRYSIDYVLLPTAWSPLDAFYGERDANGDPRFEFAAAVPRASGMPAELYAINLNAAPPAATQSE